MRASRPRVGPAAAGFLAGLALAFLLLGRSAFTHGLPARLDLADFFWPMKAYTAERWLAGGVPLWNPLSGCGEPWLAQLQSGAFYPGDLPFLLKGAWGPLAAIALHLAIAAAGMAAWVYDLGASRTASVVSGLVYAGGGPFLSLVLVYNNACTAAYLPWIFLGARRLVRGGTLVTFTASSALGFLAGEPALALAGVASGAAVALATRREGEPGLPATSGRLTGRLAGGALLAVGLTAVTAFPFAELVVRTGRLGSITRQEAVSRPVGSSELADLAIPESVEASFDYRAGRGGYLLSLALGPAPLLLACGCAAGFPGRRRLLLLLALLATIGTAVALGESGHVAPLLHGLGLLRTRFPARWFVFAHLFLAVGVGAGLDGWLWGRFRSVKLAETKSDGEVDLEATPYAARPALITAVAGFAVIGLLIAFALRDIAARLGPRLVVVSVSALLTLLVCVLARMRPRTPRLATVLAALAVLPLPFLTWDLFASAPAEGLLERPPVLSGSRSGRTFTALHDPETLLRWIQANGAPWTPAVATRSHAALAGYTNLAFGISTPLSPSPIGNPRLGSFYGAALKGGNGARALAVADTGEIVSPFAASVPGARLVRRQAGIALYELPGRLGRAFFPREVVVATDEEAAAAFKRADFDPEARAYVADPSAALPRSAAGPAFAVARVESDSPEQVSISLSTSRPRFLFVSRAWDPGWAASLDGSPARLSRTDIAFMGVAVPAGEHKLVLRYRPLSFRIGAIVSAISALVFVSFWLAGGPPV